VEAAALVMKPDENTHFLLVGPVTPPDAAVPLPNGALVETGTGRTVAVLMITTTDSELDTAAPAASDAAFSGRPVTAGVGKVVDSAAPAASDAAFSGRLATAGVAQVLGVAVSVCEFLLDIGIRCG
jgi:hypothetical protein